MDWLWIYAVVGISITLGGCYCCAQGCSHCSDGTDTETIQIDVAGVAANLDTAGCCTSLNRSYELTRSGSCTFAATYSNGACATFDCDTCDSSDCTITCNDAYPTTICNPNAPSPYATCTSNGDVSQGASCDTCRATETGTVNFSAGTNQANVCDIVSCDVSALVWDTDVMIADHPEATWASPGDFVYYCNCTPKNCTADVGNSSMSWDLEIETSGGGDVKLSYSGAFLSGSFLGSYTFTGQGDPIACITEIDELVLAIGTLAGGDNIEFTIPTSNLCSAPTSIKVSYIP